jgi:hypothetical protein
MLLDLVKRHRDIIARWEILDLDDSGPNFRLKARIEFTDKSRLHVKQVILSGGELKYSYHWEDSAGRLICRWDNARHWERVSTFPHHRHVRSVDGPDLEVADSAHGGDLSAVFAALRQLLTGSAR